MTGIDHLFDSPSAQTGYGLRPTTGRYHYPHPVTGVAQSWQRTTNLISAFSDQRALQLWLEQQTLLGLRTDESLYETLMAEPLEAMEPRAAKEWLTDLATQARKVNGAERAADRGTARHRMMQAWVEHGLETGHGRMRAQLDSLREALDAHDLEPIPGMSERRVCLPSLGVVGTFDLGVLCRRTGQLGILDLKTQTKFWSYQEVSGQQYIYDAARHMWQGPEDESGQWVTPPLWSLLGDPDGPLAGRRVALLAHMPANPGPGQLPVQIIEVDLEYGRMVAEHAHRSLELRAMGMPVGPRTNRRPTGWVREVTAQ